MSCGNKFVKFSIFGVNIIFFIIGVVILGVGIATIMKTKEAIATVTIVIGAVAVIASFLGCCGAASENKVLLILYIMSLVIVMALQIFVTCKGFDMDEKTLEPELVKTFRFMAKNKPSGYRKIKNYYSCCGIDETEGAHYEGQLPKECCSKDWRKCTPEEILSKKPCGCEKSNMRPSCASKVTSELIKAGKVVGYTMIAAIIFEILMIVGAVVLIAHQKGYKGMIIPR